MTNNCCCCACRGCWQTWIVDGLNWAADTVRLFNGWGYQLYLRNLGELAAAETGNTTFLTNPEAVLDDADVFAAVDEEATHTASCVAFNFLVCYYQ